MSEPIEGVLDGVEIAVLGLGAMGVAMAKRLAAAGAQARLWNRSPEKAAALAADGIGRACAMPREAADGARFSILNVAGDDAARAIALGADGLCAGLSAGGFLIDMGTTGQAATKEMAAAVMAAGGRFCDAPVSGGEVGAQTGTLSIMYGCAPGDGEKLTALFGVLGQRSIRIGDIGAGQIAKAANQVIVGMTIEAVATALALAEANGVDPAIVRDAFKGGFADSRILELHGARMIAHDTKAGARASLMLKDLSIAAEAAEAGGIAPPGIAHNRDQWRAMMDEGWADWDHSALYQLYRKR